MPLSISTGIGNGLMPCVPGESGAVSASSTGDDPVKIEGSSVELRMDQLSGSKEYLSRSEVITGTSDTLNVDDSLADLG